ncbi:histidine phosphatase family protein [Streptomyces sp. NPDC006339]|uniref:histidine phosphatase family protein n=1 Tax=Streptomyces sp. NPDC006339 TaxID=3156755 RepID=UPI0033BC7066
MTIRLTLVVAAQEAGGDLRFGSTPGAPLDPRTLRRVRTFADRLPAFALRYMAPSTRCRDTAAAMGWDGTVVEPALRDLDMGSWLGRRLDEVAAGDAEALASWMSDPDAAPHGGESVGDVCGRAAGWLERLPENAGRVGAVVEQALARAAVVCALSAPTASFWRVDVPPLSVVELTGRAGRWNLRMNAVSTLALGEDG